MLKSYADKLQALAVFRGILADETVACLLEFLKNPSACTYGDFVAKLYVHGDSLTDFLLDTVTEDENPYMKRIAEYRKFPHTLMRPYATSLNFWSSFPALLPMKPGRLSVLTNHSQAGAPTKLIL